MPASGETLSRIGKEKLAEEEGFEPPVPFSTTVFKTAAFNRSATPPNEEHTYSVCLFGQDRAVQIYWQSLEYIFARDVDKNEVAPRHEGLCVELRV